MATIHEKLKNAGVKTDTHESDLYAEKTTESMNILATYEHPTNVAKFTCQITGTTWYDIPFANDDF